MAEIGTCVAHRIGEAVFVIAADPLIEMSREFLATAATEDWPYVTLDGPWLGLCGTHVYRATGDTGPSGEPLYELTTADPARTQEAAASAAAEVSGRG